MYTLKAFATIEELISNTPGVVSNIGELSTQSLTFAKDKGSYRSAINSSFDIVTFTNKLDGVVHIPTTNLVNEIVTILAHVYNSHLSGNSQAVKDGMLQDLLATFSTVANNFTSGNIVSQNTTYMPEWLSWTSIDPAVTADFGVNNPTNTIKIWLSDASFQAEFDDYEIVIIPPLATVDNFLTGSANVALLLGNVTMTGLMTNVQTAKQGYPESFIVTKEYNYVDPNNINNKLNTVWNVLIYGAAGNNITLIQDAIANYILANSAQQRATWVNVFPDIFKHTEFMIIPEWTKYSIPNATLQAGIYSPIANISGMLATLKNAITDYPALQIDSYASVMAHPYKSLNLLAVGSPDNKNGLFSIESVFPDYIAIMSTNSDFSRMSQATQNFATLLEQMIITAESMTGTSALPAGMSRIVRNNILYLVATYQNINYLVAAKMSF